MKYFAKAWREGNWLVGKVQEAVDGAPEAPVGSVTEAHTETGIEYMLRDLIMTVNDWTEENEFELVIDYFGPRFI